MKDFLGKYWHVRDSLLKSAILHKTQRMLLGLQEKSTFDLRKQGKLFKYDLFKREWRDLGRELDLSDIRNFIYVNNKATICPIPLVLNLWDGAQCPFQCRYCFMRNFFNYMYTVTFENTNKDSFRHCDISKFDKKMHALMANMHKKPHMVKEGLERAVAMRIPIRIGTTFENFTSHERKHGIVKHAMRFLNKVGYPYIITTKSDLPAEDDYLELLKGNKAGTMAHVSLTSVNGGLLRKLECGAPPIEKRLESICKLIKNGVVVVVRFNPLIPYVNDSYIDIENYAYALWKAGVRHINVEIMYSTDARNAEFHDMYAEAGMDYNVIKKIFKWKLLGDILASAFADELQQYGFHVYYTEWNGSDKPDPYQYMCCGPETAFKNAGYNWGTLAGMNRSVKRRAGKPTSWNDFEKDIKESGGFLTKELESKCRLEWNRVDPNFSYVRGIELCGADEAGCVWRYNKDDKLYEETLGEALK